MKRKKSENFAPWRASLHKIIFEAETPMGKLFDVVILVLIIASILTVMLDSVAEVQKDYHQFLFIAEWTFTVAFTIEYILRLICVYRPIKYATSFFGVIDLLSILPTFISLILPVSGSLMAVRGLRLIRVFRVFKLGVFLKEGNIIIQALTESRAKITVFMTFVLLMVIVIGSIMYLVESGAGSGFTSIPRSIYWAIVTLTTVGYGDIAPQTALGQFLAAIVMIMGYAVLAVPTGIVSAELVEQNRNKNSDTFNSTISCKACVTEGHDDDAEFCKYCGEPLKEGYEEY